MIWIISSASVHVLIYLGFCSSPSVLFSPLVRMRLMHGHGWHRQGSDKLAQFQSVSDWYTVVGKTEEAPACAIRLMSILVAWEIWNERNTRNFGEDAISLIVKIKDDQSKNVVHGRRKKKGERERDCYSNTVVFVDSTFCFHFSFCNFIKFWLFSSINSSIHAGQ